MSDTSWTVLGLWLAVGASGLYHGINPGMGWPLAVSAGMLEKSPRALAQALGFLALGHLVGMLTAVVPFALLATVAAFEWQIRVAASLLLVAFGIAQLPRGRHPRLLARISPARLGLWSFAVAIAHGAGLMLVPIYLGLCRAGATASTHAAAASLAGSSLGIALLVAMVHTAAMLAAGGLMAWLVYRYLGLTLIARSWFNLDALWAASLIAVGAISLALLLPPPG